MRSATLIRGAFHRRVTPALLREPTPISCSGHVIGFRFDSALDAHSTAVAALRFWRSLADYGLDPRPRALSKSGEVVSARFSGSDAA